jgi:membrane protein
MRPQRVRKDVNAQASFRSFLGLVYTSWVRERHTLLAAALAYYGFFALAPVIFIAFTVAGAFVEQALVAGRIYALIEGVLGTASAEWVEAAVSSIERPSEAGSVIAFLISAGTLLWAATSLFVHLQNALDTIWGVPLPARTTSLNILRQRLVAFLMVVLVGVGLVVAALLSFVAVGIDARLNLPFSLGAAGGLGFIGLAWLSFTLMFKFVPRTSIHWGDVWLGGILTAGLVTLGGMALSLFLRSGVLATPLGAAGAYVVILAGMYYAAQAFLMGALFTRVFASMFGSRRSKPSSSLRDLHPS